MKTSRLTLLISEQEKERINRKAAALGISASEFVRRAADLLDPDDVAALGEIESLLPQFEAALTRMQGNLTAAMAQSEKHASELEQLASAAYRDQVRREVSAKPEAIAAAAAVFGLGGHERTRNLSRVAESREAWTEEGAGG